MYFGMAVCMLGCGGFASGVFTYGLLFVLGGADLVVAAIEEREEGNYQWVLFLSAVALPFGMVLGLRIWVLFLKRTRFVSNHDIEKIWKD
jgi:hypothetical protein